MTNKINGIDVSKCEHHYTNPVNGIIYHGCAIYEQINELGYSQDTLCEQNPNCYFKQLKRLQEENEKIKNCYACGNCKGKEDYINLEKHHIGLRKQFDELAKRNNILSLRIEELEKENEELKKLKCKFKEYCTCDIEKYRSALEEIRHFIQVYVPEKQGDYNFAKSLHPSFFGLLEQIQYKCDEVLNDRD